MGRGSIITLSALTPNHSPPVTWSASQPSQCYIMIMFTTSMIKTAIQSSTKNQTSPCCSVQQIKILVLHSLQVGWYSRPKILQYFASTWVFLASATFWEKWRFLLWVSVDAGGQPSINFTLLRYLYNMYCKITPVLFKWYIEYLCPLDCKLRIYSLPIQYNIHYIVRSLFYQIAT